MKRFYNFVLSNKCFTILVIVVMVACMFTGCGVAESQTTEPNPYPMEDTTDLWHVVYAEQQIYIWVHELDNSVWISRNENTMTPYTIDGKTVYWQGSLEATFSQYKTN